MRLSPLHLPALLFPLMLVAGGCSKEVERIAGNERLIRGPGLGTTVQETTLPDRDTYATPGTANYGTTLLVGRSSDFEARAFFRASAFSLPDTSLPGFAADNIFFELPQQASLRSPPSVLDLDFGLVSPALGDSGTIAWPGPGLGTSLGSISYDFVGPLLLNLGTGTFGQYKQWAITPASVPGFILRAPLLQKIAAFQAGAGRFRVPFQWNNQGTTVFDTLNSPLTFDLYLHPPQTPGATGADTALVLGGGFESSIALRAPVTPIGAGHSVNELRLVLSVIDSLPAVDGSILKDTTDSTRVDITIDIHRITGTWSEGVTDESALPKDAAPIATIPFVAVVPGDSLSLPLPRSLTRSWSETPASNEGILITVRSANVRPGIVVGSRESSRPPVLRVSNTSPPPGRF